MANIEISNLMARSNHATACRMVEATWRTILSIATRSANRSDNSDEDNPEPDMRRTSGAPDSSAINRQRRGHNRTARAAAFYHRERNMIYALENLFTMAYSGIGYLAFINTMVNHLQYDSPVAMAFLCHVIEKSALPSKDTLTQIPTLVLGLINKKPSRIQRMVSLIQKRLGVEASSSKRASLRAELFDQKATSARFMASVQNERSLLQKRNAAIVLSLLAERFAGEMCLMFWTIDIGVTLMYSLVDAQEDLTVRLFSLIALDKFGKTGIVKQEVMNHNIHLRSALLDIIRECEYAYERIFAQSLLNTKDDIRPLNSLLLSYVATKAQDGGTSACTAAGLSDADFIPPKGPLREEWAKYKQLEICCRWSLDRVFTKDNVISGPWDISKLGVIMNPFDATPYMKVGAHGLNLRNDRPQFESVRATACVKEGKWYYETLMLTNGIVQIGWATNRCRFSPEEGYGVGDDRNGFAFDTYRTAVWADGAAVFPQTKYQAKCEAGDVIGSLLDLDNGFCTFFINGQDYGLTVDFETPNKKLQNTAGMSQEEIEIAKKKKEVGLGLYPAVSLTTSQHVIINFGDRPWMYPPPTKVSFQAIDKAGQLDEDFIQRVLRWVKKRGVTTNGRSYKPKNKPPLRPYVGADENTAVRSPMSATSEEDNGAADNGEDYDWDGPLCTICFSEPKNVMLLPCGHSGFGAQCAMILKNCPLCRAQIDETKTCT